MPCSSCTSVTKPVLSLTWQLCGSVVFLLHNHAGFKRAAAVVAKAFEDVVHEGRVLCVTVVTKRCEDLLTNSHRLMKMVLQVVPGKKIMLLARREGASIRFSLRAGTGSPVARAPWKEEWGGGVSVENPHFQRVHYCELLASLVVSVSYS